MRKLRIERFVTASTSFSAGRIIAERSVLGLVEVCDGGHGGGWVEVS